MRRDSIDKDYYKGTHGAAGTFYDGSSALNTSRSQRIILGKYRILPLSERYSYSTATDRTYELPGPSGFDRKSIK